MSKKHYLKGTISKEADGKYSFIASTDAVDRQGDIVLQNGWVLDNFKLNPVILWAHKYDELPVGRSPEIAVVNGSLTLGNVEWTPEEANPKGQQVKNCVDGGFLNAVSVGFIPLERNNNIITRAELLEVSIVPVPANQEALRLAMSKGISVDKILGDIEKGEVANQVDAVEAYEQKWEKWCELTDIISAFWTVYFDEATPVEDFSKLLNETIVLLGQVSASDGTDDEAMKSAVAKFLNGKTVDEVKTATAWLSKAGRTISEKNKKVITALTDYVKVHMKGLGDAVSEMGSHCTAIDEMLASSSSDTGSGKTVVEASPIATKEDLKLLQMQLRAGDRSGEVALAMVNRLLGTKEIK